jgi:chromosome segregation ATPase
MDTGELRQLIDESIKKGMEDIPNTDQVAQMIDNRLSTEIVRWGSEVDTKINSAINETLSSLADDIRKLTTQVAILVEQNRHTSEIVRDMKKEHDELEEKVDKTQTEINKLESAAIELKNKTDSQEHAIFGDTTRPGTKSLFDHITDTDQKRAEKTQLVLDKLDRKLDAANTRSQTIETKVDTIQTDVEANKQFRERRQQIERAVIQLVPKGINRLMEAFGYRWVKWSALAALISLLAKLVQGMS